jgi:hypothetical protein
METTCPIEAQYKEVNLSNHLMAIKLANLGPADPRQPSTLYWGDKMALWRVEEGVARSQLCMNCAHYDNSPEMLECIKLGEGGTLKPSELPVEPRWADIQGMPVGICTRWNITCSALRTCDNWEPCDEEETSTGIYVDMMLTDKSLLEKAGKLKTGDSVSWNSSGGTARGKITKIITSGSENIPGSSFKITGTEEDPGSLIRVYQEQDGKYKPTDTIVGHKLKSLTKIPSLT